MTRSDGPPPILAPLDPGTIGLVRLSACITAAPEAVVRRALEECTAAEVPERWIEELVLQAYLFAGLPRALNAARLWRKLAPGSGRALDGRGVEAGSYADVFEWRLRGESTCKMVYGLNYEKLRTNIRALHPSLDSWMIVEGYGKVLSRPGLDLARREFCIVAACTASGQDRQLHSHLLGALNAGAPAAHVSAVLDALEGLVVPADLQRARGLWARVHRSG